MGRELLKREAAVDGVRLQYIDREGEGPGGKPPLLLLHGLLAPAAAFTALINEIPGDRRVVALDLPGLELLETDRLQKTRERDLSFTGLAELVRSFAAAVGLEKPVVLGHSHGGALALRLAASCQDTVAGLILVSPAHPFLFTERRLVRFYNSWAGRLFAHALPRLPRWLQQLEFRSMLGPVGLKKDVPYEPYREHLRRPGMVSGVLGMLRSWTPDMDSLGEEMQKRPVAIRTLLLWGEADTVVPLGVAAGLEQCLVKWERTSLPGVGHLAPEEAPELCGSLIRAWLPGIDTVPRYDLSEPHPEAETRR